MASPSDPTESRQDPEAEAESETPSQNPNLIEKQTLNPESTQDERENLEESEARDQQLEASTEENKNEEDDTEATTQMSSSYYRRGGGPKRKKGNQKKRKQYEKSKEKLEVLLKTLKPVAFVPSKTLDFDKHEKLLKTIGLWEFVHLEFDENIRQDLLVDLMAYYNPEGRCTYVKDFRINVSRTDLARALKLPLPKKKAIVVSDDERVILEDDESVKFVEEILSTWVLLQRADMWIMPSEVVEWQKDIKQKKLDKLDWADLFWFMVEKELKAEPPLGECFFASHMQLLIKTQKEELLREKPKVVVEEEEEDDDVKEVNFLVKSPKEECLEVKEEDVGAGAADLRRDDSGAIESKEEKYVDENMIELNLGQESVTETVPEEEQGPVERQPMNVEDQPLDDEEQPLDVEEQPMDVEGQPMDVEESKKEEGEKWPWNEVTPAGSHFLRRCDLSNTRDEDEEDQIEGSMEMGEDEQIEDVEEEETEEDKEKHDGEFPFFPNGDSLHGVGQENLMLGDSSPLGYGAGLQIHGNSSGGDFLASRVDMHMGMGSGSSSMFGNGNNKREIDHDNDFSYNPHNPGNKRMRTEEPSWDDKPPPVEVCLDQMECWMEKARLASAEKDRERVMNQQYLMNEIQNKTAMYQELERTKFEEIQRKDIMIYRLESELRMMTSVVEGYRKALKEMKKASRDHRKRCPLRDCKPVYKDVKGSGGLVLSTTEIEKLRLKQEAEDRITRAQIERQLEEFGSHCEEILQGHMEAVQSLDERIIEVENEVKIFKETLSENKALETPEVAANLETPEVTANETPEVTVNLVTPEVAANLETPKVTANETPEVTANLVTPEVAANLETPEVAANLETPEVAANIVTPEVATAATEET